MVLEKLRLRGEPAVVAALREHKWSSEEQKKELLQKFESLSNPDPEYVVWTATDPVPEIRAAGVALLRKRNDRAGLAALLPLLRTRSEAVRRAVGDDVDLMLDNHGQLAPGDAIELCRAMAQFGLLFLEEPVPPDTPEALAKVAAA